MTRVLCLLGISVWLVACASNKPPPAVPAFDLSWVEDGVTARDDVVSRLGRPVRYLDDGRIIFYRLVNEQLKPEVRVSDADSSLVFLFDADGVLQAHARVPRR